MNAQAIESDKTIERGIELLKLCQQFQSEKDGVERPIPFGIDKSKVLDEFAVDIQQAILHLQYTKLAMQKIARLVELGRQLENKDKLSVSSGDDYSDAALDYLEKIVKSES